MLDIILRDDDGPIALDILPPGLLLQAGPDGVEGLQGAQLTWAAGQGRRHTGTVSEP